MIAIIDCGISNLRSIAKALEVVGGNVCVSNKANDIRRAERIVLPGVGAFGRAMKNLRGLGLIDVLARQVIEKKKPFLGICLGMQLLASESYEYGVHQGLSWLKATVKPFQFNNNNLRVPHMGWDDVVIESDSALFSDLEKKSTFYFVHSYYMDCDTPGIVAATCNYGGKFPAAVLKDNILGVQFHPEKSQKNGLTLLKNFVNWKI